MLLGQYVHVDMVGHGGNEAYGAWNNEVGIVHADLCEGRDQCRGGEEA